jgi:hypothetical protein
MPIPTELFATIMGNISISSAPDSAAAATRVWRTMFRKFSPLLGPLSADLLFARSLAEQEAAFPWLPRIAPGAESTAYEAFERSLDSRSTEDILAANRAMLLTYTTVLADLIGMRLATNFLGAAFAIENTKENI